MSEDLQFRLYCFVCHRYNLDVLRFPFPNEFFVGCIRCRQVVLVKKPLYKYIGLMFFAPEIGRPKISVTVTKIG